MLRFVGNESSDDPDSINLHAALFALVRDLEAAPDQNSFLEREKWLNEYINSNPPARRTITREEFNAARVLFLDEDMTSSEVMTAVAAAWRLTVEDA